MKIGIIGAMDIEVETLISKMQDASSQKVAGMDFTCGTLAGVPAVIGFCKVGKVNAALCVQVLVSEFGVTHLINTGVAGSLDARINIGDLVVSTDAVHHDMDVCNLGYEPGQVPGMDTIAFPTDEKLAELVVKTANKVAPELGVFRGRVASGEQFVRTDAEKQRIISQFGALCTEMEGAAIAHAAYLNKVPCVIVRAISDKADGTDAQDYPTFEARAAATCAEITYEVVAALANNE